MGDSDVEKLFFTQSIPYLYDSDLEKRQKFNDLWRIYQNPKTHLRDPIRIQQFMSLISIANTRKPADYLEIGTFQGESARLIYQLMDKSQTLYCCDTFEGFEKSDLEAEREVSPNHTWTVGNFIETSPEAVGAYIGDGQKPKNVEIIKGWFPKSFEDANLSSKLWRFIHIDMDLFEPTRAALEILWPNVVAGGIVVFHDYDNNCFPGVKIAVDDFAKRHSLTPFPMGDLWGSAVIIKELD